MALALVENASAAFAGRSILPHLAVAGTALPGQHAAGQAAVPSSLLRTRGAKHRQQGAHRQHNTNHWPYLRCAAERILL